MKLPLVVDLDGTLIYTDTLYETFFKFIKKAPLAFYQLVLKLMKGKIRLKKFLAEKVDIDVSLLPYNQELIDWLKKEKQSGRKLILCTASYQNIAIKIADYLGFFDEVIASEDDLNLKGKQKSHLLNQRFGQGKYQYVGNSKDDIHVWKNAHDAILVSSNKSLKRKVEKSTNIALHFSQAKYSLKTIFQMLRCHQWLKNLLIFVPLLAAHRIGDRYALYQTVLAFISYSLCASSVYILNDLLDVESDRKHPRKKNRPFASGSITPQAGLILMVFLFSSASIISFQVSMDFSLVLLGYYILTSLYSFKLKQIILLDCMVLALLYNFRIFAGFVCGNNSISFWLITFSIFLFYSLALVKRYAEIVLLSENKKENQFGRDYHFSDKNFILTLGLSSGLSAVIIFGLYLNSHVVKVLYHKPELLGLAIPMMLYWISWMWLKASRGQMHDDPLIFACREKTSLMTSGLIFLTFVLAS